MSEHFRLQIGQGTHPGLARGDNQDASGHKVPGDPAVVAERGALFVVCDGIGGLSSGQIASAFAVDAFIRAYYGAPAGTCDDLLRQAVQRANDALYRLAHRPHVSAPMGTTVVAGVIRGRELWVLNVGDSRGYLWRGGDLHQITRDHIPQPAGPVRRDRSIDRALGTDPAVLADVFGPLPLNDGDCLVLCSDGLSTTVPDAAIARTLDEFEPEQAVRRLIEQAITRHAPDNVSVTVVRVASAERAVAPDDRLARMREPFRVLAERARGLAGSSYSPLWAATDGHWRSRQGALVLLAWAVLAVGVGMMLGWQLSHSGAW